MPKTTLLAVVSILAMTNVAFAAATDAIGVPACDEFIAKYEACVTSKATAASKAKMSETIAVLRDQYRTMAASAATREQLPSICRQSLDITKAQTQAIGCQW